ncbi:Phage integrase family protein [Ruminococcaceae bacterium FB2012]|nr:Phage integrase family protein [Ruminococcaceae bacterium FB2012]
MSKRKSIKYQVRGKLTKRLAIGKKRHRYKDKRGRSPYIHSWSTYNSYVKHCIAFGLWVRSRYDIGDIDNMQIFVETYLQWRISQELSAWTIALDAAALAKLYDGHIDDFDIALPQRHRADVKRSRGEIKHFDEAKHQQVVNFCKSTGLRRHELAELKKADISEDGKTVFVRRGKGGKSRTVPTMNGHCEDVTAVAERCQSDDNKVFSKSDLPARMPIHRYRADYAKAQYQHLARPVDEIPRKDRYVCRRDKAGTVYDKQAMAAVSKMLGHNRIDVIAYSYL